VKRKSWFNIGAYQHVKKIAMQNAQAEQFKAVQELANRVVEKETRLVELTKKLNATTKKVERRKRKVRDFFRFSLTIGLQRDVYVMYIMCVYVYVMYMSCSCDHSYSLPGQFPKPVEQGPILQ